MNSTFRESVNGTRLAEGQIALWYLGQEGFLLHSGECSVLIDPYLSDYVDRSFGGAVRWQRRYPAPVTGAEAAFADYVFCTHEHAPTADPWTVRAIAENNPKTLFFASAVFAEKLAEYGVPSNRIVPVEADRNYSYPGISFTPVPAAHEQLHRTEKGYAELGFRIRIGGADVYHAGDCCPYDGLAERVKGCDIMLLPINGRDYYRLRSNIIGNMNAAEAAQLASECGAGLLVPMHFDLYDVNAVNPASFVDELNRFAPAQRFHIFRPGERLIWEKQS